MLYRIGIQLMQAEAPSRYGPRSKWRLRPSGSSRGSNPGLTLKRQGLNHWATSYTWFVCAANPIGEVASVTHKARMDSDKDTGDYDYRIRYMNRFAATPSSSFQFLSSVMTATFSIFSIMSKACYRWITILNIAPLLRKVYYKHSTMIAGCLYVL